MLFAGEFFFRPDRPLVDPGSDQGDLLGREAIAFWGHDFVFIGRRQALEKNAFRAFAGDNEGLSGITTLKDAGLAIEADAVLLFLFAMAFVAAALKYGTDIALEVHLRGGRDATESK